ncbi:YfiR/HmsC family protein [Aquimarina spongiae]|uniref:histidine kinase n=1 Tax=Aquimarina spongiae TaxID=570521 RepID=A0A1M6GF17_9FLAO|nr:YfiR/HmsC family protein [Aquimarina spongiae]SHJ08453.1 His Kinase A (phospho-acceptor) domain-containing protein [Aquimarina spongiae]
MMQISLRSKESIGSLLIGLCLCFFFFSKSVAQELGNEEVKRLQRAIFVFNFAQQVGWPNLEDQDSFKIGVLGPDRTTIDLSALAQKRKIFNKPVEIIRFQQVKDVKEVHLLYVNNKYNYEIYYILSKIRDKNILLVTEDYNFNASMINMVNVGDSFEYEINLSRIQNEGFTVAPSLRRYAITSSEKWKRLYKKTEKSLTEVQEENKEKESQLEDKDREIQSQKDKISNQLDELDTKKREISTQNRAIRDLYTESQIQQKKFEEKVLIEEELEKNIQDQIDYIQNQEKQINNSHQEILEQNKVLEEQKRQIEDQNKILEEQTSEIDTQKKINILLISLVALFVIAGLIIYRGYLAKKRFNKELQAKNLAIYEQSLELEAKNKELEQFAYIASHDLQEPLNTISSFIGLIAEDYGDSFDDVGKESLFFIKDASIRMKKLIDALLEYSRLGRNRDYVEIDCNKVLEELKEDLGTRIKTSGAKIIADKLPVLRGSEIEFRLLLQNLISNGIKFRGKDTTPEIKIECTKITDLSEGQKDLWKFSVQDNGIGIPEEHQERIFAIFQRLHSREEYQGTGIGLAHCKKIVESHGGKIWLNSEVGKGSTFYFTLPA